MHTARFLYWLSLLLPMFLYGQQYIPIRTGQLWGLASSSSNAVLPPIYSPIKTLEENPAVFVVRQGDSIGLWQGGWIVPIDSGYTTVTPLMSEGYGRYAVVKAYEVQRKGLYGVYDTYGQQMIPCISERAIDYSPRTHTFKGMVQGKPIYGYLMAHSNDIMPIKQDNGLYGFYKIVQGMRLADVEEIMSPRYEAVKATGPFWAVRMPDNNAWGVCSAMGQEIVAPSLEQVRWDTRQKRLWLCQASRWGFMGRAGEWLLPPILDTFDVVFHSGVAIAQSEGNYGMIDTTGGILQPFEYDRIRWLNNNRLVELQKGDDQSLFIPGQSTMQYSIIVSDELSSADLEANDTSSQAASKTSLLNMRYRWKLASPAQLNTVFDKLYGLWDKVEKRFIIDNIYYNKINIFRNEKWVVCKYLSNEAMASLSNQQRVALQAEEYTSPKQSCILVYTPKANIVLSARDIFTTDFTQDSMPVMRAIDSKTGQYMFINKKINIKKLPNIYYVSRFQPRKTRQGTVGEAIAATSTTTLSRPPDTLDVRLRWGVLRSSGEWTVQPTFAHIQPYVNHTAIAQVREGKAILHTLIDTTGKSILPPEPRALYRHKQFGNILIVASKSAYLHCYNAHAKLLFEVEGDSTLGISEGVMWVRRGNLWGLIDTMGKELIKPQYTHVSHFCAYGFAICSVNSSTYGIIDKEGKWLILPKYRKFEINEANGKIIGIVSSKKRDHFSLSDFDKQFAAKSKQESPEKNRLALNKQRAAAYASQKLLIDGGQSFYGGYWHPYKDFAEQGVSETAIIPKPHRLLMWFTPSAPTATGGMPSIVPDPSYYIIRTAKRYGIANATTGKMLLAPLFDAIQVFDDHTYFVTTPGATYFIKHP